MKKKTIESERKFLVVNNLTEIYHASFVVSTFFQYEIDIIERYKRSPTLACRSAIYCAS